MPAAGWEARFCAWTGKASDSEQERYERTCRATGEALAGDPRLGGYEYEVYPKGSYPNFTNVVVDSDVGIAVELTSFFKAEFVGRAEGLGLGDVGYDVYRGDATLAGFKDDVERALARHFGEGMVERGNKAIRAAEGATRLPADVVPCVTERTFTDTSSHYDGIRLLDDRDPARLLVNYPVQHLERGKEKNAATSRRYKRAVRILKRLENEMVELGVTEEVPSFLIESGVWNVPDGDFAYSTWTERIRAVLAHIFNATLDAGCVGSEEWLEANGVTYLFHAEQSWSHRDAHRLADAAWDHIGFD